MMNEKEHPWGVIETNDQGSCMVKESSYPLSYLYGGYPLGELLDNDEECFGMIARCPGYQGKARDFIFLDLETTGLSSGTGTVPFLTGIGFFGEDSFVVRQYFMRDFDDEPCVLEALNGVFSGSSVLVTFNGRAFDWNILTQRYIFNRMRPTVKDPCHIDLLYPSRRIWKGSLESCRLSSLEENILKEFRVGDIPGALIPSVYFDYLDSGSFTEDMKKVLEHNRRDVLSMAALLARICSIISDPFISSEGENELFGAGRIFEAGSQRERMIECFEGCMESYDYRIRGTALKKLSAVYKRGDEYDKAVRHWIEHSTEGNDVDFRLYSMIELAKYYEHKKKDHAAAIKMTQEAISVVLAGRYRDDAFCRELYYRLKRLKKKAERSMEGK